MATTPTEARGPAAANLDPNDFTLEACRQSVDAALRYSLPPERERPGHATLSHDTVNLSNGEKLGYAYRGVDVNSVTYLQDGSTRAGMPDELTRVRLNQEMARLTKDGEQRTTKASFAASHLRLGDLHVGVTRFKNVRDHPDDPPRTIRTINLIDSYSQIYHGEAVITDDGYTISHDSDLDFTLEDITELLQYAQPDLAAKLDQEKADIFRSLIKRVMSHATGIHEPPQPGRARTISNHVSRDGSIYAGFTRNNRFVYPGSRTESSPLGIITEEQHEELLDLIAEARQSPGTEHTVSVTIAAPAENPHSPTSTVPLEISVNTGPRKSDTMYIETYGELFPSRVIIVEQEVIRTAGRSDQDISLAGIARALEAYAAPKAAIDKAE